MAPSRVFDFDGDPPYAVAVRTIVAALDDDGQHLSTATVGGERIRAVRLGAVTRYVVPDSRVRRGRRTREEAESCTTTTS